MIFIQIKSVELNEFCRVPIKTQVQLSRTLRDPLRRCQELKPGTNATAQMFYLPDLVQAKQQNSDSVGSQINFLYL